MKNNCIITLKTIIRRNDLKFLANSLGEEMVMMNMENGDFISLNSVGATIWLLTELPLSIGELVQKLLGDYDISADQCAAETLKFLESGADQEMFLFENA
jgi:hypothetical protein